MALAAHQANEGAQLGAQDRQGSIGLAMKSSAQAQAGEHRLLVGHRRSGTAEALRISSEYRRGCWRAASRPSMLGHHDVHQHQVRDARCGAAPLPAAPLFGDHVPHGPSLRRKALQDQLIDALVVGDQDA
jgi:hypothetical protein